MQVTIDQALQKAIMAHKTGKAHDANRLYTAIIQAEPKHPDANHNLGILTVSVGKVQEALPFFKTALEANPEIAQFWLSYIDALLKLNLKAEARLVLKQANSKGFHGDAAALLKKMTVQAECGGDGDEIEERSITHQSNILDNMKLDKALRIAKKKMNDGFHHEAKSIYQNILSRFPTNKSARAGLKLLKIESLNTRNEDQHPSKEQLHSLRSLIHKGELQEALG